MPTVATGYTEDSVNLLIKKAVDDATDKHRKKNARIVYDINIFVYRIYYNFFLQNMHATV